MQGKAPLMPWKQSFMSVMNKWEISLAELTFLCFFLFTHVPLLTSVFILLCQASSRSMGSLLTSWYLSSFEIYQMPVSWIFYFNDTLIALWQIHGANFGSLLFAFRPAIPTQSEGLGLFEWRAEEQPHPFIKSAFRRNLKNSFCLI